LDGNDERLPSMPEAETAGGEVVPVCGSCKRPLSETLKLAMLETVANDDGPKRHVEVTYCGACGHALSASPRALPPQPLRVPDPDDSDSVDGRFQIRCRELIEEIERVGFMPGGWIGLITRHGAVGAARQLLSTGRILPVTRWLVERDREDLTMEREITRPEWDELFDDRERSLAEERLQQAR
jgi:hypothetical protein